MTVRLAALAGLCLAAFFAAACGSAVRERPGFYETNRILQESVEGLPDDGLADYREPDPAAAVAGRYLADRALDLADIPGLSLLGGYGLSANVRATKAVQAGAGWYRAGRFGFLGRHAGAWWEERWEGGVSIAYAHHFLMGTACGPIQEHQDFRDWTSVDDGVPGNENGAKLGDIDILGKSDRDFFDVGATAMLGVVGVDAEIRLAELADFLLGLGAIDISADDTTRRERDRMVDLARTMVAQRPADLEAVLAGLSEERREPFFEHSSDSVKAAALRSIRSLEAARAGYCRMRYERFLDRSRSDLQEIAATGLARVTGLDFGFDPDRSREENERAIERLKAWLREHPAPGAAPAVSPENP
ncbi:MAG: hypothetical protein HY720_27420 [Planctomycetes bacterium]|nr:hypothetical protein [Planctomycetota bacterium]